MTVRFSSGPARKAAQLVLGVLVAPAALAWLFYRAAVMMSANAQEGMGVLSAFMTGASAIGASILITIVMVGSSVRLDGTVVTARVLLRRRRADIATARAVWFGQGFGPEPGLERGDARGMLAGRRRVFRPHLIVLPADSPRVLRVPLTTTFGAQPQERLEALAAAVAAAPKPPNAAFAAEQLRTWRAVRRPV
ncbi:hypothetical protein [Actinorhabdospora filicis]|uniref:hypothetical protein n=1 Tax=Actinorhabdospora filicis TaxID=1785913 RepID=UPI002554D9AD|nr:hypothetical protein [Actinorhabdospora filicis]